MNASPKNKTLSFDFKKLIANAEKKVAGQRSLQSIASETLKKRRDYPTDHKRKAIKAKQKNPKSKRKRANEPEESPALEMYWGLWG